MNKKIIISALLLAGTMLLGCNPKEILEPTLDYPAFVVIDGDTVKTTKDLKKAEKYFDKLGAINGDTTVVFTLAKKTIPTKKVDLAKLKNDQLLERKNKPFRMVAIGGDLTQGKRDGGYYSEAMETSYPTLIAQQMGVEFVNPTFDKNDYNGIGRRVKTNFNPTGGPVPKSKLVNNNLGIDDLGKIKENRKEINNYYITSFLSGEWFKRQSNEYHVFSKWENGVKDFDFLIIEQGFNDLLGTEPSAFRMGVNNSTYDFPTLEELKSNKDLESGVEKFSVKMPPSVFMDARTVNRVFWEAVKGLKVNKGVILNIPFMHHIPYYTANKTYYEEYIKIMDLYKVQWLNISYGNQHNLYGNKFEEELFGKTFYSSSIFLPSTKVDSLLGKYVNPNLKPGFSKNREFEINHFTAIPGSSLVELNNKAKLRNSQLEVYSQYTGMPIVDINVLYEKIRKGEYVTNDGVKVDGRWPEGNFFSSDGIFPTAFGQAVIANEVIKVINSYFKVNIELISTRHFLNP